jgi:hypothetical protein
MIQDGTFGPERKRSEGRPKWKLVDENEGKELDISSSFCIPVKSKAMKRTADADKEEWDVVDGDAGPTSGTSTGKQSALKSCDVSCGESSSEPSSVLRPISKQPMRARSAIKPLGGKGKIVVKPTSSSARKVKNPAQQKRDVLTSPSLKRKASEDFLIESTPARQARKAHNVGGRRSVLQN